MKWNNWALVYNINDFIGFEIERSSYYTMFSQIPYRVSKRVPRIHLSVRNKIIKNKCIQIWNRNGYASMQTMALIYTRSRAHTNIITLLQNCAFIHTENSLKISDTEEEKGQK